MVPISTATEYKLSLVSLHSNPISFSFKQIAVKFSSLNNLGNCFNVS